MAELNIGKHCSLPECKQLDFLPFECDGCGLIFCKEHQVKDRHSCQKPLLKSTARSTSSPYQKYRCSLAGCKRSELVAVVCSECELNHCMLHRHPSDHRCGQLTVKANYMSATAEHVKGILDSKAAAAIKPRRPPKTKKALALAAKVALMKLKQTSTGDAGVPMDSRVYVNVQLPATDASNLQPKYSPHWLDQEWTVGRTVDYISNKCKVRNDNNMAGCPRIGLLKFDAKLINTKSGFTGIEVPSILVSLYSDLMKLRLCNEYGEPYSMEKRLKEMIGDGSLHNGSTVELCYISEDST